jgi:hypothetical protein
MARLGPVPAARHASLAIFVQSVLKNCTYMFLCQDTTRRDLELHFSGPYQVLPRNEKMLQLLCADMVKPAYVLNGTDRRNNFKPGYSTTCQAATALHKNYALRYPHPFLLSLQHLSNQVRRGGDVGTSHSATQTISTA